MQRPDGSEEGQRLYDKLCSATLLREGFQVVRKNKGSPGIDGITIEMFESRLDEELGQLQKELEDWTYQPMPVRQVDIPKPGNKNDFRKLGIPSIRDRTVQAVLKLLLEPIFEPLFSEHSYGFRPGRNQRQAVEAAQRIVAQGKEFCADVDLSKFFDRVHHDRLISRLGEQIADKRILRLIGLTLRSGIMKDGLVSATTEGTVQGSPLSPLLSNVVLDELDKELEKRGIEFCRFADDCNAFFSSEKAAERGMANITRFVEGKLRLVINREKSKVDRTSKVKFLGMTIICATLAISATSINRAMAKVKDLTPRGTHQTMEQTVESINTWYVGWSNYYSMTQYPSQLVKIEAHIRRRLRSRIVDQQKRRRHLYALMVKRCVPPGQAAKAAYSNKGRWALSRTNAMEKAFPNKWFEEQGLKVASNREEEHWFDVRKWIKVT